MLIERVWGRWKDRQINRYGEANRKIDREKWIDR